VSGFAPPSIQARRRALDVAQLEQSRDFCGLVRVLEDASADDATREKAARVLGNFERVVDRNDTATIMAAGALPLLVELLSSGSDKGRQQAAWALANLALNNDIIASAFVAAGALPMLVELLSSGSEKGRMEAAWALANLAANKTDDSKAAIVAAGGLPPLTQLYGALPFTGGATTRCFEGGKRSLCRCLLWRDDGLEQ
jgi:mannose/fructose-specific phosphotransferase system component IIA